MENEKSIEKIQINLSELLWPEEASTVSFFIHQLYSLNGELKN
jgi:hypothetical protein